MSTVAQAQLCHECQAELSELEVEVSQYGGGLRCDTCRDKHYYESPRGQLELIQAAHELEVEKLQEEIASLQQVVIDTETREVAQHKADLARIEELEGELASARERLANHIGPRSRPSPLT